MAVSLDKVYEALKTCYDPEIPINIVDLGLIYDVQVDENDKVYVKMTLTAPGCPIAAEFPEMVRQRLIELAGAHDAEVEIVWFPPWNPDMMSEEAKRMLGWI
ncbi:MAG: iron-sulfur cluster assembly protein [Acidobacteria bacterium]|nr:iron-sulfur cluster assembly protein [Acidobacteriota bacterium]MDW7983704.1 iron-sulfur cluster assembly protein [Acidobacteriota bacterium]